MFKGMFHRKSKGLHSKAGIKGHYKIELFGPDGRLKDVREGENTVTELGDAHVADQMSGSVHAALGFMSVGTGNGQVAASTGLAVPLDQNALTSTTQGVAGDDNDVIFVGTWIAGDGTGAITEAGIFRLGDNLTMNYYDDFAVINKLAADSLVITWTVTYGAS